MTNQNQVLLTLRTKENFNICKSLEDIEPILKVDCMKSIGKEILGIMKVLIGQIEIIKKILGLKNKVNFQILKSGKKKLIILSMDHHLQGLHGIKIDLIQHQSYMNYLLYISQ